MFVIVRLISYYKKKTLWQGCKNPGSYDAMATKFYTVTPDVCEFSVWDLPRITLLAPRILCWLLDFSGPG
jgi:hypothetical protein